MNTFFEHHQHGIRFGYTVASTEFFSTALSNLSSNPNA